MVIVELMAAQNTGQTVCHLQLACRPVRKLDSRPLAKHFPKRIKPLGILLQGVKKVEVLLRPTL